MSKPATIFDRLAAPFDPKDVEWRVGSTSKDKSKGMALAYVDARAVMDRLDDVCGPAGWQDRYEFDGPRTICYLSVRVGDDWITKADGAGDTQVEAEKGSISGAFKRAAVKWGIGRYLYDVQSPWVRLNQYKQIEPSEFGRLQKILPARIEASADDAPPAPAKQPPAPPAEPVKPHAIPVPGDHNGTNWVEWGTQYVPCMRAIRNVDEGYAWIDANAAALSRCAAEAPKVSDRIRQITKEAMDAVEAATPDNRSAA